MSFDSSSFDQSEKTIKIGNFFAFQNRKLIHIFFRFEIIVRSKCKRKKRKI